MDSWLTGLARIDREVIDRLIEGGAPENEMRDFKREMPLATDNQKDEFLKDITALANTEGGWLLIGIEDRDDVAVAAPGIDPADAKQIETIATSVMRERIEPPINTNFQHVDISDGRVVLAIHARKSLNPPHAVISKYRRVISRRVGRRNDYAKVSEIRDMVLSGATMRERLAAFHKRRLAAVMDGGEGRTSPLDTQSGFLLLHVVPMNGFEDGIDRIDLAKMLSRTHQEAARLPELLYSGCSFDKGSCDHLGYTQAAQAIKSPDCNDEIARINQYGRLFYWGGVELFTSEISQRIHLHSNDLELQLDRYFKNIKNSVTRCCEYLQTNDIPPPYSICLSLGRSNNIYVRLDRINHTSKIIATDTISYGPHVRNTVHGDDPATNETAAFFDRIWQAAGHPYCPYARDHAGD